jgi:hypothetical protein
MKISFNYIAELLGRVNIFLASERSSKFSFTTYGYVTEHVFYILEVRHLKCHTKHDLLEYQRFMVFQKGGEADSIHSFCVMFANQYILKHLVVHVIN